MIVDPPAHPQPELPNAARMYDYWLGGSYNYAVDRAVADRAVAAWPELPGVIRANRVFLRLVTEWIARQGIRQFLDLGSGIPTVGNVHDAARRVDFRCRTVYVDRDPVAVAHGRQILEDDPRTTMIEGDIRDAARVLAHPEFVDLLDLDEPIAVTMFAILHFVPDEDDPAGLVGRYRDAMAPGSYLAISHAVTDEESPETSARIDALFRQTATPIIMRTPDTLRRLLDGMEIVPWTDELEQEVAQHARRSQGFGEIARKPTS